MPTPPAMKIARLMPAMSIPGGGHTKLPPTRTLSSFPTIVSSGCHSHAAGGLSGLFCTANSKKGVWSSVGPNTPCAGVEVRVKPPAFSMPGT